MHLLAPILLLQATLPPVAPPVLEFPEAGLDDPAAYAGYATRFFRDARRNAFQVYLDRQSGRVVHLWADADNASAAFTVRDLAGRAAPLDWGAAGVVADTLGRQRVMRHRLRAQVAALEVGWFLLGTMRQERDFQYAGWHERPFGEPPFVLAELRDLIESLEGLPAAERDRHLALLGAGDLTELRSRLEPRLTLTAADTAWVVRVAQTSLDGRSHLSLELRGGPGVTASHTGQVVSLRARAGRRMEFDVVVTTDAPALTPLERDAIFNDAFRAFYQRQQRLADSLRGALPERERTRDARLVDFSRLDREVRALELLSSEEKLMAGLPNFATYFGRDMMMAALMLEPIVSVELQEHVIASVLRKLAPSGDVSHEEALGGQAIRENAAQYSELVSAWRGVAGSDPAAAAEHLARARALLADLQAVRENYRMIDDDFQFPVLVARYLARADVPAERKRRFLGAAGPDGERRLDALVRNLALVAAHAQPYVEQPLATNLVGFLHRDERGWLPGSWRDSRVGYGSGRFAMDVNAVWVPHALDAVRTIFASLGALGYALEDVIARVPGDASALQAFARAPEGMHAAIAAWRGARRHFEVEFAPDAIRARVAAALATLPEPERAYWGARLERGGAAQRPLAFLALALDSVGHPIAVANTDPATALFLEDYTAAILGGEAEPAAVMSLLDVVARPYPVGLFVDGLGPLVANDVYASTAVQRDFRNDLYHSPKVVWGREVNLLFLGLARQIAAAYDESGRLRSNRDAVRVYVSALRRALDGARGAVEASGLRHNELWSYRIEGGTLHPARYGTSSDIQLWNVTDLAVRFSLDRLPPP